MISMSDVGIWAEIIGFVLLLLVGNRSPNVHHLTMENSKPLKFDIFREKIIPDKYVSFFLSFSIVVVISGLIFQLIFFNPPVIINTFGEEITQELVPKLIDKTVVSDQPVDTFWQTIGVIVSILVLAFSIYQFGRNQKQHYKEQDLAQKQFNETQEKAQKLEFMKQLEYYQTELTKIKTDFLKSPQIFTNCEFYAEQHLDILNRISFLEKEKLVNHLFLQYFESDFNAGRMFFAWLKFTEGNIGTWAMGFPYFRSIKDTFNYSTKWIVLPNSYYYYVSEFDIAKTSKPNYVYNPNSDPADPKQYFPTQKVVDLLK